MNAATVHWIGSVTPAACVGLRIRTSFRIRQGMPLCCQGTAVNTGLNSATDTRTNHLSWDPFPSSQNCWNPIESVILARGFRTSSNSSSRCGRVWHTQSIESFPVGDVNNGSRRIRTIKVPATLPESHDAHVSEGSSSGPRRTLIQHELSSTGLRHAVRGGGRTGVVRRKQQQQVQQRQQQIQQQMQQLGLLFQREATYLNLENNYLSWMRNGLLATSCAMIAYGLNDWHASVSGMALLSIGGVSLLLGSVRFLLVLPQVASHHKHARNLQLRWKQLQQPQLTHRQEISQRPKRRPDPDWVTDISVAVHVFVVACVGFLWVVAARGIAGSLPPETKGIISPLVFPRTLHLLEGESSQPSDSNTNSKA